MNETLPFLGSGAAAAMQAQHSEVPAKAQGLFRAMGSCGDTQTLTPAPVTHSGQWQLGWPPCGTVNTSHLQCKLETQIAPLVQSSVYLSKIHPESNTYSQGSVGTAPELHLGVRRGVGMSDSRTDGFTSTLCQQSCQFFMQMGLFSAKN